MTTWNVLVRHRFFNKHLFSRVWSGLSRAGPIDKAICHRVHVADATFDTHNMAIFGRGLDIEIIWFHGNLVSECKAKSHSVTSYHIAACAQFESASKGPSAA